MQYGLKIVLPKTILGHWGMPFVLLNDFRRPFQWSGLRVSWAAGRFAQTLVVGWRRDVPVHETARTESIRVAASGRGRGAFVVDTTVDVA
jgi:hypothetical protein